MSGLSGAIRHHFLGVLGKIDTRRTLYKLACGHYKESPFQPFCDVLVKDVREGWFAAVQHYSGTVPVS